VLTRGFGPPPEKLADEPYTNMNKPARLAGEKPGVGGYPRRPETGISDEDGVAVSGSLLLSWDFEG